MKTTAQIIASLEQYKAAITSDMLTVMDNQKKLLKFFHTFLLDKYPPMGGQWQAFAASILADNLLNSTPDVTFETTDLYSENQAAIVNILAQFDDYFKNIFTKYINRDGNLIPVAAYLGLFQFGDFGRGEFNNDFQGSFNI